MDVYTDHSYEGAVYESFTRLSFMFQSINLEHLALNEP